MKAVELRNRMAGRSAKKYNEGNRGRVQNRTPGSIDTVADCVNSVMI